MSHTHKLSLFTGKVAANVMSRRKGNNSELASAARCSPSVTAYAVPAPPQAVEPFGLPQSNLWFATLQPLSLTSFDSSPINGGAFWCGINSYIKPALKGEVGFAQAKAGGVPSWLCYLPPPLSRLTATAPRPGSLLKRRTGRNRENCERQ